MKSRVKKEEKEGKLEKNEFLLEAALDNVKSIEKHKSCWEYITYLKKIQETSTIKINHATPGEIGHFFDLRKLVSG